MDKPTIIITAIVTAIFGAVIITSIATTKKSEVNLFMLSFSFGLLFVYVITYAFKPKDYELTAKYLIINRVIYNVKINREDIRSIEKVSSEQMKLTVRTFGVGGLFGYFGKFYNKSIGKMTFYTTQRNKRILVKTMNDKNIILSPDEPEKLIEHYYLKRDVL